MSNTRYIRIADEKYGPCALQEHWTTVFLESECLGWDTSELRKQESNLRCAAGVIQWFGMRAVRGLNMHKVV